jgi:predicted Zn-dependent protease
MMLDADFDRDSSQRRLLRTHELGHAIGYHHVTSRPSVMNPEVGNSITEFDRTAIRRVRDSFLQK